MLGSYLDTFGSESFYSGMMVQDPSKKDDVDEIFNQARQLGAVEGPLETPSSSSRSFTGTGRLLSGESVATAPPQQPDPVAHNIIFWSNGFTIDDGPLRKLDDPENASFLEVLQNQMSCHVITVVVLTFFFSLVEYSKV